MKRQFIIGFIMVLGGLIIVPRPIRAQEKKEDKNEKTITIKKVIEKDGKKTVIDTTFTITGDMDKVDLEKFGLGDSDGDMNVDVQVISDGADGDEIEKHIVVIADGDQVKFIENGDHSFYDVKPCKNGKMIWVDKDGKKMTMTMDVDDIDFDIDKIRAEIDAEVLNSDSIKLVVMQELEGLEGLKELEELKSLKELDKVKEIEWIIKDNHDIDFPPHPLPPPHPGHGNAFFFGNGHHDGPVTDIELRDAGIKSKTDRLDADEVDINIEDGVVDFTFVLKEDVSPKLVVYNISGDKVFSGKPEKMNGKYSIKMDLSKKQYGTYYIMVSAGNASFTERLHL